MSENYNLFLNNSLKFNPQKTDVKTQNNNDNDFAIEFYKNSAETACTSFDDEILNLLNTSNTDKTAQASISEEESYDSLDDMLSKKYLDKPLEKCTTEELKMAYAISLLDCSLNESNELLENQNASDGVISEAFNSIKELTDLGISKKDAENAIKQQNKIIDELKEAISKSPKDFKKAYQELTGVEYDEEKINNYQEKSAILSLVSTGLAKAQAYENEFKNCSEIEEFQDVLNEFYGGNEEKAKEKLSEYILSAYQNSATYYSMDISSVEIDENNKMTVKCKNYDGEEYDFLKEQDLSILPLEILIMLPNQIKDGLQEEFLKAFEDSAGINCEELQNEYTELQKETIGEGSAVMDVLLDYCNSQEGFIDKFSGVVSIAGITMIAAGGLLTLTGAGAGVGMGLMQAGVKTSTTGMFLDNGLELVDTATSKNYDDIDSYKEIARETILDAAFYFSGRLSGKISANVADSILKETESKLLSTIGEIGVDASIDVLTDLILLGEIDLQGEALNLTLSYITGLATSKVNKYQSDTFDETNKLYNEGKTDEAGEIVKNRSFKQEEISSQSNEVQAEKAAKLVQEGINSHAAEKIAQLDDSSYKSALDFIEKGIPASKAADMASIKNGDEILSSMLASHGKILEGNEYYLSNFAELNSSQRSLALDLMEEGFSAPSALKAANIKNSAQQQAYIEDVKGGNKKMLRPITPEIEEKLSSIADDLNLELNSCKDESFKIIEDMFTPDEIDAQYSARIKSSNSILAKLKERYESGSLKLEGIDDYTDSFNQIQDGIGTRIKMKSLTEDNTDFNKIFKDCECTKQELENAVSDCIKNNKDLSELDGKYLNAINKLKEAQNKEVFEKLLNGIGNKQVQIKVLNNYGNELSSYFTDRQLIQLADAYYKEYNEPLKIITKNNLKEVAKQSEMSIYNEDISEEALAAFKEEDCKKAVKDSGYTSSQMKIVYTLENGEIEFGELQLRGSEVNAFADVEHVPYDIREGKITAGDRKYSEVYNIIKNMSDESYKAYNEYLSASYNYLKAKELGMYTVEPEMPKDLTYQNGTKLNSDAEKLNKEGLIKIASH